MEWRKTASGAYRVWEGGNWTLEVRQTPTGRWHAVAQLLLPYRFWTLESRTNWPSRARAEREAEELLAELQDAARRRETHEREETTG